MTTMTALFLAASSATAQPTTTPVEPPSAPDPVPQSALPDGVRAMIENAIATGNEADVATVVRIAKASHPLASVEIDRLVQPWLDHRNNEKQAAAEVERNRVMWSGRGELGGFRSTGTIDELGLAASISLKRKGPRWTHLFRAGADYRRTDGATARESLFVAYEPRLQLSPRTFTYGLVQFERAPFLGYSERYTASAGLGSKFIDTKTLSLSIDTGPAFRSTDFVISGTENRLGWRASSDFDWQLSPTVTLRQDTNAYVETSMQTITGLFALDTKLIARLSARFSYDVRYESPTDVTARRLDTMSKVTLVYDF